MATATPKEVRQARAFLFGRGLQAKDIPPRRFANAAKEMNLSFQQLLHFISMMYAEGQNQKFWRLDVIKRAAGKQAR